MKSIFLLFLICLFSDVFAQNAGTGMVYYNFDHHEIWYIGTTGFNQKSSVYFCSMSDSFTRMSESTAPAETDFLYDYRVFNPAFPNKIYYLEKTYDSKETDVLMSTLNKDQTKVRYYYPILQRWGFKKPEDLIKDVYTLAGHSAKNWTDGKNNLRISWHSITHYQIHIDDKSTSHCHAMPHQHYLVADAHSTIYATEIEVHLRVEKRNGKIYLEVKDHKTKKELGKYYPA